MQEIKINELKTHPKNDYFFDDMLGQKWTEFLESIKTSGVIEPIVITQDKTIVSGHQRVRACKELGIDSVLCTVKIYDNDSQITKDLIETNVRQRGDVSSSSLKMGRIITELERIYGVRQGSANPKGSIVGEPTMLDDVKTQEDIAESLGIENIESYRNYKKLTTLLPELQELVDTGTLSTSTASRVIARLSPQEQQELILTYGKEIIDGATQRQVQEYVDETIKKEQELCEHKKQLNDLENEVSVLKETLDDRPQIEVKVVPDDYDSTKDLLNGMKTDYSNLEFQYNSKIKELSNLKEQIRTMTELEPEQQFQKKLKDTTIFFCSRVNDFIEKTGGMVWLVDHIKELPEYELKSYLKAINTMNAWVQNIKTNLDDKLKLEGEF